MEDRETVDPGSAGTACYADWLQRRTSTEFKMYSMRELLALKPPPDFWWEDREQAFRDGFTEGFDYAIEEARKMYKKKGFTRVTEVCNILLDWSDRVLEMWRHRWFDGRRYESDGNENHPLLNAVESWADIRARIIRRDGKCQRCGDVIGLEVDHAVDVQNGGLPTDENLRTLCKVCHNGKRFWSA